MKRREFIDKAGRGMTAALAARFRLARAIPKRKNMNFSSIREEIPPLSRMTYLDTAYVGLVPRQIHDAHIAFLEQRLNFDPMPGDKTILGVWMNKMEKVRTKLAGFIGAETDEVAFTLCTGCGSNIAVNGIDWRQGDNVVIDELEYPTDFHVLNALKKKGVEVRIARHENGVVSPEMIEQHVDHATRAIVVSHVSYINGYRHNLKVLADIIHAREGYLIVDAAQSIGGVNVDVKKEDVDFLTGIPYKWLCGPNGLGFLYIKKDLIPSVEPDRLGWASTDDFISLESMESKPLPQTARRFEYGTLAFESIYGLDASLDLINTLGINAIEKRNYSLINRLRNGLQKRNIIPFTPEDNKSPILTFHVDDEKIMGTELKKRNIRITARRWFKGHIRVSPHFYNNENDIDLFLEALDQIS